MLATLRYVYIKLFIFLKVNHDCIFNIYIPYKAYKMSFSIHTITKWNSDFQITVYMVLSQKKFAPLWSKGKPFFSTLPSMALLFSCKNSTLFFFFQSNRSKTLTRLACYAGRTVFFPPRSLHFLFSSHGRSKK